MRLKALNNNCTDIACFLVVLNLASGPTASASAGAAATALRKRYDDGVARGADGDDADTIVAQRRVAHVAVALGQKCGPAALRLRRLRGRQRWR